MSIETRMWILAMISVSGFSYLIGGFIEWEKAQKKIKELKQDVLWAYAETDAAREQLFACRSRQTGGN